MKIKTSFLIKYIIFGCLICINSKLLSIQGDTPVIKEEKQVIVKKKHTLIVLIHGTIMPWIPNMYTYQPFGQAGLHDISYDQAYISAYPAAFVAALLFEKMYEFVPSSTENTYTFCTFSWNGNLSARQRKRSADDLYHALIKKTAELQAKYPDKEIEKILAGHSHGSNLILNLAASEETFCQNLVIDKAILLGTPVQSKTEKFIYSPIFKNVYSFFSYGDFVQILDVLSSPDAGSRRRFDSYKKIYGKESSDINIESHVKQISVKIEETSPRHNELWCFGGSGNYMYRDDLIIAPLPVFIFMPIIIDFIDRYMKDATLMQLKIEQQKSSYKFSCTNRRKLPKKYKDCYCTISFDDIMQDFYGDFMIHEAQSTFQLIGFDLN